MPGLHLVPLKELTLIGKNAAVDNCLVAVGLGLRQHVRVTACLLCETRGLRRVSSYNPSVCRLQEPRLAQGGKGECLPGLAVVGDDGKAMTT